MRDRGVRSRRSFSIRANGLDAAVDDQPEETEMTVIFNKKA
jgi:hypothetical protein